MSTISFIEAMPKAELSVQLEGAIQRATLMNIADQNEVSESIKKFSDWAKLVETPDYARLYDLIRMSSSWLKSPDNLVRIAYDVGTVLAKQNVRYAEVGVNPGLYPDLMLTFDDFLAALNDGRDRAKRAWGIEMAWVFNIPRDEPRRADELARWATTASARRGGVVALGLSGEEKSQPVGQFERAFSTAEKKEFPRVARAGEQNVESLMKTIEALHPNRLIDGWGAAGSADAITALLENSITLAINFARAQKQKWVASPADYPLRKLYDDGVSLVIGSDMPSFYHTSLKAEYITAVEQGGLSLDELENVALNAVRTSFMEDAAKAELLASFTEAYAQLRTEHIEAAEAKP